METSKDFSTEIISLFTDVIINPISKTEDFSEVKITYCIDFKGLNNGFDYTKIINKLNERDTFHLSIHNDGEVVTTFTNRSDENFNDFISSLNDELIIDSNIEVVLTIEKNKKENFVSVYFLKEFVEYLKSLSFLRFLNVMEKNFGIDKLILEIQENNLDNGFFGTQTILVIDKKSDSDIEKIESSLRENIINNATSICHWDIEKKRLLPEDLYPIVHQQTNQELLKVFQKTCLLYTTMFIFDYLSVKEIGISYKLNGFKTFGEEIAAEKIEDIHVDVNSVDLLFKIYQWIYNGGNTNDKISIARNIISLNYDSKTIQLSTTTFDAILSNYKIYERQNVKQYIEVRNKLSEILIDLQGKIDKIVDNFIGDYKKNIFILLSFFISVIAIRVVSKGDFVRGFTSEIIILSYSFLLISIGILIYSRWEFSKRISMFEKHYSQLKDRYSELLSEDELIKIFDDCNPKNKNSKSFTDQQKKMYTVLWVSSIIILTVSITVIHFSSRTQLSCYISKIIQSLLCFTKNT